MHIQNRLLSAAMLKRSDQRMAGVCRRHPGARTPEISLHITAEVPSVQPPVTQIPTATAAWMDCSMFNTGTVPTV